MTLSDLERGAPVSSPAAPLSIALGSFDGVHIGHRALIERARRSPGADLCVFTFAHNPFGVPALTPLDEKLALFRSLGVRYALVCDFDEIRGLSPEGFVSALAHFGASALTCGFNYSFGAGKSGSADTLRAICARSGIACSVVDPVLTPDGETVSSTRVGALLASGSVDAAAVLLGRPHSLTLPVVHGARIGHKLGFPTVNQIIPADRAPLARGVYISSCRGLPSVTNVGVRPTVSPDGAAVCETHIVGLNDELYGASLTVEFRRFLRPERKFDSLDALKKQIAADVNAALRDY